MLKKEKSRYHESDEVIEPLILEAEDSDFPASDVAGNGAKIAKIPMIPMHTPAITGSIKYDMLVPATIPKKKGINNCATEMKNLIPIVAIPVYL